MITVVIPVLNESEHVAEVVQFAHRNPAVTEVIVIDDGSVDETTQRARQAGAKVITSTLLGKGASMEDGLREARNEIVLYLDGDLTGLSDDLIHRLTDPILRDKADFVKASFSRSAGRVTTLTAKPLLRTFFPELAHFDQPLGGIVAARRPLLLKLVFETDYGADVGLLIDAWAAGARLAQVDIGQILHDSHPLDILGEMATQVARTILRRAADHKRLDDGQLREIQEIERQMSAEFSALLRRVGSAESLALFDMDGVLLDGRFVIHLAEKTARLSRLKPLLDNKTLSSAERTRCIATVFAGVPQKVFERLAREIPLTRGAVDAIIGLRKAGYRVGIVSDSYFVATEIVCRRVFADFSVANVIKFRQGIATGEVTIAAAMSHADGCRVHEICKLNVLKHLMEHIACRTEDVVAVGDGENDICLLHAVGKSIAFEPKTASVRQAARFVIRGSLRKVLHVVSPPKPGLQSAYTRFVRYMAER